MQNPIFNDFTAGEISSKLSGRTDLEIYNKSAELLQNFQPMTQGGTRRRPGTQYIADLPGKVRLIPFVVDATNYFLLEFSNLKLRVWQDDALVEFAAGVTELVSPYPTSALDDIHHTQSYDRIFFTHQDYPVRQLSLSGSTFAWEVLSYDYRDGQTVPFNSTGNYPKTCAIVSSRLWLASTISQPATIWGSVPFDYNNFTDYSIVSVDTIEYADLPWDDASIPEYDPVTIDEEVINPDHAIEITLGSDKNEEIMWISGQRDIVVGTLTGEYIIPGNIDALNQYAQLQSRFGSAPIQGKVVSSAVLFVQSDLKKIREYYSTEQGGYQSPDLTWHADHILQDTVIDFDFQRTPDPRVYAVLSGGALRVFSYSRMYNVLAWARWETEGTFDQVCVLDAPTGQIVYIVVTRTGTRRLEKLYEPYTDVYHLDCASTVTSSAEAVITYPFASDDWVIMDSGGDLVTTPEADTEYTIGFLYTSHLKLNRLSTGGPYGTGQTRVKRATEIRARVVNSYAFTAGYKGRLYTNDTPLSGYPYTGDVKIPLSGEYDSDLQLEIIIATQRPLMITAIVPDVGVV